MEDTAVVPVTVSHLMMVQIEDEELPVVEEYMRKKWSRFHFFFNVSVSGGCKTSS